MWSCVLNSKRIFKLKALVPFNRESIKGNGDIQNFKGLFKDFLTEGCTTISFWGATKKRGGRGYNRISCVSLQRLIRGRPTNNINKYFSRQ